MPELPEVETTLRGILPHIQHQKMIEIVVRQHQLRWPIPSQLQNILSGKKILAAERRAKYLLLKIDTGTLIIHLGMSGHLRILNEFTLPRKHDHVDILFGNNKILRFNDPRRFGAILWTHKNPQQHVLLKHLGVEPLTKEFSGKYLWSRAQKRNVPIKSFIMDNKVVVGIGNIYAAEALFETGIFPGAAAKSISAEQFDRLAKSVKGILKNAIKRGGTTLKDFLKSDGKPGYFSHELKVYGRTGLPCVHCHTPLKSMKIGQRNTVYCEACQKT
jgi:formamidopyrimidine-DNA glycosylase